MATKREFKVLNEREHILTRPAMYIGSIVSVEKEQWVYCQKENKFKWQTTKFVPALLKICDEIVDNSLDVGIDTDFKKISTIKVTVSDDTITIEDDGPGIPVAPPKGGDEQGRNCPEIAWTQMRSGTSFKEDRKGPSANGVGSTCCNVFCTSFIGTSDDGTKRQTVTCSDNMSNIEVSKETKSKGKAGVRVEMKPDLKRFKLKKIDDNHKSLIYQRLLNLAICYPQLTFYFNGKKISVNGKKFAAMFSDDALVETSNNATIVVFPNEYDEFKFYSFVNGLYCVRGGTQVDFVASEICNRVRDKLIKKYKTIRPGDVKNKLGLVVFLTDFENAQFDAQTKESLANSQGDINRHLNGAIDFDKLVKNIQKTPSIIDPVVEAFKIKEELKAKKEMKASKKVRVKSDKYMSSIGEKNYLCLAEGACLFKGTKVFSAGENKVVDLGDLNVGDMVFTHECGIKQVTDKTMVVKDCVKIRTAKGREVICSKEHRWFIYDKETMTFRFRKTKDLIKGRDVFMISKLHKGLTMDEINVEDVEVIDGDVTYKKRMYGKNYEMLVSDSHRIIVYSTEFETFIVKTVAEINTKKDYMVLVEE